MKTGGPRRRLLTLPTKALIIAVLLAGLVYLSLTGAGLNLATSLALRLMPYCKLQGSLGSDAAVDRQTCFRGPFAVEFTGGQLARASFKIGHREFSLP